VSDLKKRKSIGSIILISLAVTLVVALVAGGCAARGPGATEPVKVGLLGGVESDFGKSSLRSAQIAIEEINEAGGILGGRMLEPVIADTAEDVTEAIKAYEYLNEVENVDFIISYCTDDESLGWMPRLAEYQTPTIDTWTSAIRMIEQVRDEPEKYKAYFMNHLNDYFQGVEYVEFARDILYDEMGWRNCVLFYEDTAYGHGVGEFIRDEIAPGAGIEVLDEIVYDVDTFDFTPLYDRIIDIDPDFIYIIASVNTIPPSAAYVSLEVPIPLGGVNCSAACSEFWDDMGAMAAGFSSQGPLPWLGVDLDPVSQAMVDKYQAEYPSRPRLPVDNYLDVYYGIYMAVDAAEKAGGFEPLDAWVEEMEKEDIILWRYGGWERRDDLSPTGKDLMWFRYRYCGWDEVFTNVKGLTYPHNIALDQGYGEDLTGMGSAVNEWYPDGSVKIIHPPRWANGEYYLPPWIPENKRGGK
jgi:branched-chain amino acid transport system substrate-binding protein